MGQARGGNGLLSVLCARSMNTYVLQSSTLFAGAYTAVTSGGRITPPCGCSSQLSVAHADTSVDLRVVVCPALLVGNLPVTVKNRYIQLIAVTKRSRAPRHRHDSMLVESSIHKTLQTDAAIVSFNQFAACNQQRSKCISWKKTPGHTFDHGVHEI